MPIYTLASYIWYQLPRLGGGREREGGRKKEWDREWEIGREGETEGVGDGGKEGGKEGGNHEMTYM